MRVARWCPTRGSCAQRAWGNVRTKGTGLPTDVGFTSQRADDLMVSRLRRSPLFKMYPDDEDLLEDVLIEIQQAIETTNISSNILTQTVDAFGSIISNNLNVVVKLLTSMTIILTVPMLVASIYGMNVDLPFAEMRHAFWIVMGIALGAALFAVYIFWKRDWF